MNYLIIVTCIWAFSFPLIGYFISGQMDSFFAIFMRVFLAFLVFLPFLNWQCKNSLKLKFMGIGGLQIGIMYIFYYHSFLYLNVAEVALFTIFTPFYVSLIYDLFSSRFRAFYLLSISICVLGAYIIKANELSSNFLIGFLLIQGANLVFGTAQSLYKIVLEKEPIKDQKSIFGYFHLGASLIAGLAFFTLGDSSNLPKSASSWAVLIYLGFIASGLGYFWWNKGATMVDSGVLAIMNNALIPAAVLANALLIWLFFPEKQVYFSTAELVRISIGIALMFFSLWIHYKIIKHYEKIDENLNKIKL
ncbi:EamA family transporter [Campylobacter sp. MIT 97-5078]|uniref:EamA family transporter n=1 Tax=Campylobacter sp. MIT 97-5078 TaxID=1548153 RepID=UPI000512EDB9|nr:EamA family transporter [Campylobacter sp. MIT 97-5078]KGI55983.1 membrane protein [Campylobacter sp. MIT 97-5078]KGI57445.1 membrane protein [Campylobacter sp. MIT 97-5078]KGI57527.1 membrane protein [Campylobacter sp. MIT 97-5078]TQR27369.1 hypothetical protein DMB91_03680 [Campylobacter sp. MIT 97-5078]